MALGITKTYTPATGNATDASAYNTDLSALFNAFSGLEAQTSSLGGLTITPASSSGTYLNVTNSAGTSIFKVGDSQVTLGSLVKLYFDGGSDTYIVEGASNRMDFYTGGTLTMQLSNSMYVTQNIIYFGSTSTNTNITFNGTTAYDFYLAGVSYLTLSTTYMYSPNSIRIGADSADNGIDDATGGTASTPLYIGNQLIGTSTGTTGGTGSAGSGKQYVQLKIGATTYKILTDGTI